MRIVLAVEILTSCQAVDFRAETAGPSPATAAVYERVREVVPSMLVDRHVGDQIDAVTALLPELVERAEAVTGTLD